MVYENIFDKFKSGLIKRDILPNIFSPSGSNVTGIGEKILNAGVAENIYGTSDDFISSYKQFQQYYFELLSDPTNIRKSFSKNLNVELMRKSGTIDLSILNLSAKRNAERMFSGRVLKLDTLMNNVGFPNLAFPTANPYRTPFKFEVDQNMSHPAQVMLNRMIFNVDPTASSIADIRFGTQNISSIEEIERNLYQIQKMKSPEGLLQEGKKIITFDVETTGILPGSQVRSIALAERTSLSGLPTIVERFGFESERLGGILAGPTLSDTLSSFISKQEGLGSLVRTEEDFLKNMKSVMTRLLEADQVTGHNVNFDINQIIKTMTQMKGFESDNELNDLVSKFLEKKTSNKDFLIDTLEIGRAYVTEKAQSIIGTGGAPLTRGEEYIKRFFSVQSLADVQMGGRATYVGVENFAMNTNLLELMAEEQYAPEIYRKIFQGSHIAETDTILQDHILKYIHNKTLTFKDLHKIGQLNVSQETIDIARKTIFKSQAITPVTNIADPKFLTQTALNYVLSDEGLKGISAVVGADDLVNSGLLAGTQTIDPSVKEAYIKYQSGKFNLFTGMSADPIEINQQATANHLRKLVRSAQDSSLNQTISGIGTFNPYEKNIISLGINYGQNQSIEMINRLKGITPGMLDVRSYINNVGMLYENFADPLSFADERALYRSKNVAQGALSSLTNFSAGVNSARNTAEEFLSKHTSYAQAMLGSGNRYGFLGIRENILSNIVSMSTRDVASGIYGAAVSGQYDEAVNARLASGLKYAMSDQISDITSQFNIGHFLKQKNMILTSQEGQAKKILLSYEYFQNMNLANGTQIKDLLDERKIGVSLSLAQKYSDDSEVINLTWKAGRDASGITSQEMATRIYDDMMSDDAAKKMATLTKTEIGKELEQFKLVYGSMQREEAIKSLTDSINERGIGIGYLEGAGVERIKEGFARMGQDIGSDAYDNMTMNIIGDIEDGIQTGALYDAKVVAASGSQAVLDDANASAIKNANTVAEELNADKDLLNKAIRNLRSGRRQARMTTAVEMYNTYKGKAGIAALGVTALVGGYYMYKNYKENQLYNETLEQQPYQKSRQTDMYNNYTSEIASRPSYRRDPLVTAGVVGNLDNRKIGHTQMGNNKYNHLYGGV